MILFRMLPKLQLIAAELAIAFKASQAGCLHLTGTIYKVGPCSVLRCDRKNAGTISSN